MLGMDLLGRTEKGGAQRRVTDVMTNDVGVTVERIQ